ncbi:L-lactate MFS transporter [Alkaliphilus peptidifermentans]|uniref:MFS transporter, OFA family, oxalate/formate antiporter n=1 Tax=Alkaliphilus peptidifermentans DSM 18978 TaxID=1120976 RepID=A0A1G5J3L9_9FIRM|nr:OFA family MFS transporter [Alkaliphilus peptidifermentans]SCY82784.1 MFS transporter, OFA family, oxalate/formate antiporter [Alkaliphilus peptidifermentans DSM 18978]
MSKQKLYRGWIVTIAGLGVNLMLGVLYAWGVISAALIDQLNWNATMTQIPYMVACALFALSMVPGGRLQDKLGPKPIIMASAILAGIGFIFSGIYLTTIGLTIFFGIVFGAGMGIGYAAPTPAAVKWFDTKKRGVISGIVVSGFGLAPVYIAPLTTSLLNNYGIKTTFFFLGIGFFTGIMLLAQFISNPPKDYVPQGASPVVKKADTNSLKVDYEWQEVLKTKQFYHLWIMFCFGTFAGLLIIGQLSKIGLEQAGMRNSYMLISIYAFFNFAGRIGCGVISDKLGRMKTLFIMFLLQVAAYVFFPSFNTPGTLMFGIAIVGFTFGGMLTIFPSVTADYFGLKNFGVNYGLVITAWGIGGVFGPLLGGIVKDVTNAYTLSYIVSGVLSAAGAILTLFIKAPSPVTIEDEETNIGMMLQQND